MKQALLLLLVSSFLLSTAPRPAAPPLAASSTAPQNEPKTLAEFWTQFRQAQKIGADKEMTKIVRRNQALARDAVIDTCTKIMKGTNEQLETDIAALRKAWKKAFKSDFVDKVYTYYSLFKPALRRQWEEVIDKYNETTDKYRKAKPGDKGAAYVMIGKEYKALGEAFAEFGDDYFASECYLFAGICLDEDKAGKEMELVLVIDAYKKCASHRRRIDLEDPNLETVEKRIGELEELGYQAGNEETGEAGEAPRFPGIKLGSPTMVEFSFELLQEVGDLKRPLYGNDQMYQIWNVLAFGGVDSVAKFPAMEDSVSVYRTGPANVMVDVDRDGAGDLELPIKGKILPVQFEIGSGRERRSWGFFCMTGDQQENYQGIETNLQADNVQMQVMFLPAASMVAEVDGTRLQILDDNADGKYGSPPLSFGYVGMSDGHFQPDLDSMVVGKAKAAIPYSDFVQIGKKWYHMEPIDSGVAVNMSSAKVVTGTLKLEFKGPKPEYVILRGEGPHENSFFDIAQGGKKGVKVPRGNYTLFAGMVKKGKRDQIMKTLILPGERTPTWDAVPGEVTTVKLGGPFGFDFDVDDNGADVTVKGNSVCITGVSGERYERPWNCAPRPEASLRKAGSKKGGKPEKMDFIKSQEEINTKGFETAWFPYDLTLPKKNSSDEVEIQLTEKKNKLFGKITSDWIK